MRITDRRATRLSAAVRDVRTGRFERSLSALTAAGAVDHHGRDLPVARRRQLRQQDDVVADRRRADRGPGRHRRGVLPRAAHTVLPLASAAIVVNGLQGTYLHLARRRAAARRHQPATTSRPGRRCSRRCWRRWSAGWACWPRCCAARAARRRRDALMPYRSPNQRAVTPQGRGRFPASTCSTRSTRGTTSPPASCWPGSRCPSELAFFTPAEVGHRRSAAGPAARAGRRPARAGARADRPAAGRRRDRRLALRRPARGRPGLAGHACAISTMTPEAVRTGAASRT